MLLNVLNTLDVITASAMYTLALIAFFSLTCCLDAVIAAPNPKRPGCKQRGHVWRRVVTPAGTCGRDGRTRALARILHIRLPRHQNRVSG